MIEKLAAFDLPISHPVHIFAVVSVIILLAPILLTKLRLPGTVGLILAGLLVGPNGLNILAKDDSIILFGTVGILYIMFLSGLEVDFLDFRRSRGKSLLFGLLTFSIPQAIGTLLAYYVQKLPLNASVLLASMYASHTLLAYPIASRLGITRNEAVVVAIGGTLITNTISLSILAVITSSVHGQLGLMFWGILLVSFIAFGLITFVLLPRFARWFFFTIESEGISQFAFILSLVFVSASVAHLAGIEPVIGAFFAGLSISRLVPAGSALLNRIHFVGNSIFIPFFLIYVGMLVDFRVLLRGPDALVTAAIMTATATGTKWLAAFLTQKILGYSRPQRNVIFGLSNAQAANTLAAIMVGYKLGILNENILNGTIIMIFVTCVISAMVVDRAGIIIAMSKSGGAPASDLPGENQRLLVPIANMQSIERLLDFAFIIKDPSVTDPVYPLTVVTDADNAQKNLAEAQGLLQEARRHASAGENAVKLISRIDVSATSGILRVIKEMRITGVVLGWGSERSAKEYFFGSLHEHLLDQSTPMVIVNGIRSPLNIIQRIVVILPPHVEFEYGFKKSMDELLNMRRNLKVPMLFQGMPSSLEQVRMSYTDADRQRSAAFVPYTDWDDMPATCEREMNPRDITVFFTARKGCISWDENMEKFAKRIRRSEPDSNIVLLYAPAQEATISDPRIS